jgi:hypothetical protein
MSSETIHVREGLDAPGDATHALLRPGPAINWLKLGGRHEPAYWWRRNKSWVQDVHRSDFWLDDPQVVPKVFHELNCKCSLSRVEEKSNAIRT